MIPAPLLAQPSAPFWTRFTGFDWLLVVILLWSTLQAFWRSAIREVAGLVGAIAGLILASWNYPLLAVHLRAWLHVGALADIVSFLLIVSAVTVVASLLGRSLRSGAHAVGLGLLDRSAGAALGFIRGVLLGVAIMMASTAFLPPQPAIERSELAPYLLAAAHGVSFVVPQQLQPKLTFDRADHTHGRASESKPLPVSDPEGDTRDQDRK